MTVFEIAIFGSAGLAVACLAVALRFFRVSKPDPDGMEMIWGSPEHFRPVGVRLWWAALLLALCSVCLLALRYAIDAGPEVVATVLAIFAVVTWLAAWLVHGKKGRRPGFMEAVLHPERVLKPSGLVLVLLALLLGLLTAILKLVGIYQGL